MGGGFAAARDTGTLVRRSAGLDATIVEPQVLDAHGTRTDASGAATASNSQAPGAGTVQGASERTRVNGIASTYAGTAGWIGEPVVALPGALGGRYTGHVNGTV